MTDRYTVSESPFGFEADVGTARLRYALTDNRPTHVSVYVARERERQLRLTKDGEWVPFRHICYGAHKEDLQDLVMALNYRDNAVRAAMLSPDGKVPKHGL